MKYDDDQCVQCGAIRAAGSTLCIDCLVRRVNSLEPTLALAGTKIEELEERVRALSVMVERLLAHITAEAVYTAELRTELFRAIRRENGKDGMA